MSLKQSFKPFGSLLAAAFSVAVLAMPAEAAISPAAFGEAYRPVQEVSPGQTQMVYYRDGYAGENADPAYVYIDREFHTGLLPGGYTVFCLTPGTHELGATLDDAPRYTGKQGQPSINLMPGRTQFIRVDEDGARAQVAVNREEAERELAGKYRQMHVVSRARSVRACQYEQKPAEQVYTLSSDVLFSYGKSGYGDIRDGGRQAIADLVNQLDRDGARLERVEVVGHTDAIGSMESNDALGLARARTVRQVLIDNGLAGDRITVRTAGSREPVSQGCVGSRDALIACYTPDRRVVIRINGRNQK